MEESPCLDGLPILALEHLVDLLDYKSRKTCRLVCKKLKRCVDDIGHAVKIDTRKAGSTRFSRSVNITEAHVIHMKSLELLKNQFEKWKTAVLSGPINNNWLSNELQRKCINLHVLIITESCLTSQDFSLPHPIKPFPIFNHLTQLQLYLTQEDYTQAIIKLHQNLGLVDPSEKIGKKLDDRIQRNMAYFLQTIRSRVMKVVYAAVFCVNFSSEENKRKVRYEHEPLFEFIQCHSKTLEEIHVPNLMSTEPSCEDNIYKTPIKLKTLVLTMRQILTYWKAMLLNQKSLQNLFLHSALDMENNAEYIFYLMVLKSTICNNARTLVRLRLSFSNTLTLDMKMFKVCKCLEYIAIETFGSVTILNLNQLPLACLNTVLMMGTVSIGPDFDGVQFLENSRPQYLRLNCVSNEGPFGDPSHMLKFVQLALRSRNLNSFNIVVKRKIPLIEKEHMNYINPAQVLEWLAKSVEVKQKNPNAPFHHILTMWDIRNLQDTARSKFIDMKGEEYLELEAAVDLNFLEAIAGAWMHEPRKQPFCIPRKAESFTFWQNQMTRIIEIEPHYKPYNMRVNDISRVKILIDDVDY